MSYSPSPLLGQRIWHSLDTLTNGTLPAQTTVTTTVAWPAADTSLYHPIVVPRTVIVKSLWYANGSTATGNYDIGLYDAAGNAILRKGSAAKTTTQAEIVWDCTDTTLSPGLYYLALAASVATDTFSAFSVTAPLPAAVGVLSEATFPLPATASWGVSQTVGAYYSIGMFLNALVT